MPIAPFDQLDRTRIDDAWVGGVRRAPTWHRSVNGDLDRAGFHALVRSAQLPLAELVHMGAILEPGELLDRSGGWVDAADAALLLRRIAWDAVHGNAGEIWVGAPNQRHEADKLAADLIAEMFDGA